MGGPAAPPQAPPVLGAGTERSESWCEKRLVPPQDAVSVKAEPGYRGPVSEPEPVCSREAADYREAGGQQGLAYTPEAVYASTEAPGHYPGGMAPAGVEGTPTPVLTALTLPACPQRRTPTTSTRTTWASRPSPSTTTRLVSTPFPAPSPGSPPEVLQPLNVSYF